MKTWKKVVLWIFAIVLLLAAIGAAYQAGFRQGKIEEICTQLDFNLSLNTTHYSILKELETDELAQNRQWRQVMGNLGNLLYNMVCFVDQHPGDFVYEGQDKESFERNLQKARKIAEDALQQARERLKDPTNPKVKTDGDSIQFSRNKEEEK